MTKVIFRKFQGGEVIALFPQEPASCNGLLCLSYMHIGQHGCADQSIVHDTKPAMRNEFYELKRELERIGYDDLKLCHKFTYKDFQIRKERARL